MAPTSRPCLVPSHPLLPCPDEGYHCLPNACPPRLEASLWDYFAFCMYLFNIKNTIHELQWVKITIFCTCLRFSPQSSMLTVWKQFSHWAGQASVHMNVYVFPQMAADNVQDWQQHNWEVSQDAGKAAVGSGPELRATRVPSLNPTLFTRTFTRV